MYVYVICSFSGYTAGFILAGCLIVMMGVCSTAALKIQPPLQHYNSADTTTSFTCINDDDNFVSADDIEWFYPNFTIITSTLADGRICGTIDQFCCLHICITKLMH